MRCKSWRSATDQSAAHRLIGDPPPGLPEPLLASWQERQACRDATEVERFAEIGLRLAEECRLSQEEAAKRLADHDDRWSEPAAAVAAWCMGAREAAAAGARLPMVKAADAWLHEAHDGLRAERMAAQMQDARRYWTIMRRQSNVSLGEIRLAGNRTQRKVELDVTVDEVSGAALGVMSQGNCTRLPEAVRRLRIRVTIMEVCRKERSMVRVKTCDDPVESALKDARAVLADTRLPPGVAAAVLPGLRRVALESAFVEVARRRLLTDDADHDDVERRISEARRTSVIAALALGVEPSEVMGRLCRDFGPGVFRACNSGAHEEGDFRAALRGTGRNPDPIEYVTNLARRVREVG
ncbi:hypothetical protein [Sphaerisporangium rhizosphaerae]|uniref:DUF222 domain-containing protein n=1 Tax=Sphaerisporangium rhizosphaerae TaxID=2269375 RepID=A0ABW2P5S7_9ACTN